MEFTEKDIRSVANGRFWEKHESQYVITIMLGCLGIAVGFLLMEYIWKPLAVLSFASVFVMLYRLYKVFYLDNKRCKDELVAEWKAENTGNLDD